jgi:NAD(P)H-dependent FMN reductase
MPTLHVVLCSTRPNRIGEPIAKWFMAQATAHGGFTCELIDLKAVNLPPMDEPEHPMKRLYQHAHTKAWSAKVASADAFVCVTPEYNFSAPPALLNAMNYLFHEWASKPLGFVSYGGVSGGLRSVQVTKATATALKMVPLPEAVTLPFAAKLIENGVFNPPEVQAQAAAKMLDELLRWDGALRQLRKA